MADLGTERLPWCRFRAFLVSLPWDSAYARAKFGGDGRVSLGDQIAAMALDHARAVSWARADPKKRGAAPPSMHGLLVGDQGKGTTSRTAALAERLKQIREDHRHRDTEE